MDTGTMKQDHGKQSKISILAQFMHSSIVFQTVLLVKRPYRYILTRSKTTCFFTISACFLTFTSHSLFTTLVQLANEGGIVVGIPRASIFTEACCCTQILTVKCVGVKGLSVAQTHIAAAHVITANIAADAVVAGLKSVLKSVAEIAYFVVGKMEATFIAL